MFLILINPISERNQTMEEVTDIQIGKIYKVNHSRKGRFSIQVTYSDAATIQGTIIDGVSDAILDYNIRLPGESITMKRSLCTVTE